MTPDSFYFDRQGEPMDERAWCSRLADRAYCRVALTQHGDVEVSTVWIGLNHRYGGDGPPLIFETMVFGGPHDSECWRWTTEAEARAGHAELCSALLRGAPRQ